MKDRKRVRGGGSGISAQCTASGRRLEVSEFVGYACATKCIQETHRDVSFAKKNWALSAVLYSERSVFGAYDGLHLRTAICYGSFVSANIVEMIEGLSRSRAHFIRHVE
jgi:hypothetical protein